MCVTVQCSCSRSNSQHLYFIDTAWNKWVMVLSNSLEILPVEFRDYNVDVDNNIPSNNWVTDAIVLALVFENGWIWIRAISQWTVRVARCTLTWAFFSLTWCLERKIPVGKKPVSLSSPPLAGEVWRSFSGDDKLIPPLYRALPAQRAPEAFQPPRNSQEFSPSLQTGNWSQCVTAEWEAMVQGVMCWLIRSFFFPFFFPLNFSWFNFFC